MSDQEPLGQRTHTWRAKVGVVLSLATFATILALWLVNRYVFIEVEIGRSERSLRALLFDSFTLHEINGHLRTLSAFVYPKANWVEQTLTDFYSGAGAQEHKTAQLTVVRYTLSADLGEADAWYRKSLGSNFVRNEGWFVNGKDAVEEWLPLVRRNINPEAVVYRQKLSGRVRGVLLEKETNQVLISLYDFQE